MCSTRIFTAVMLILAYAISSISAKAATESKITVTAVSDISNSTETDNIIMPDSTDAAENISVKSIPVSPYELPYSLKTTGNHDWRRLWVNTGVLTSAFVGTLLVLECLPEDATSWNRAELQDVPLFRRWHNHVVKEGPEWDHDKFIFNYVLHPYAGAAYYMSARTCGFNFWQSFVYCTIVSNVGWEYGVEAFMERPSIQDLIITPVVGSCIGEGFYRIKRHIVNDGYTLFGSKIMGHIVAFLVDPVNEFTGLWLGNPALEISRRKTASSGSLSFTPTIAPGYKGFSIVGVF